VVPGAKRPGRRARDKILELTALGLDEAELLLASANGEDA
jgi:hypothetical protein